MSEPPKTLFDKTWDAHEVASGWQLCLAVWDAAEGLAWALTADDEV